MADNVIEVDEHSVRSLDVPDDLIEYRLNTSSTKAIIKFFMVQYINGRKSEIRECSQCADLIRTPNDGITAMHKQ